MGQTRDGAALVNARRLGLTIEAYRARVSSGSAWCTGCKTWHELESFGSDKSRPDGRAATCREFRQQRSRDSYIPTARKSTKGRKMTTEQRARMSAAKRGQPSPKRGIPRSPETKAKISQRLRVTAARGADCHSYKDGKAVERRGPRFSLEARRWRTDVFRRDGFTCQDCGDAAGGNLRAHHLKGWADHPDLRFELTNGVTLCDPCHKRRHRKAA